MTDADIQKIYKANRVCFNEAINREHFARAIEAEARKEQADKIAELERQLDKAQEELNCAEAQCEAFLCAIDAPESVGSDGFDCMGDFVRAIQTESLRQLESARKDSDMMTQVNRACLDLPDGYEIEIRLENGAGTIRMTDENGDSVDFCEDFDDFSDVLKSAIDAAIKAKEPA